MDEYDELREKTFNTRLLELLREAHIISETDYYELLYPDIEDMIDSSA